MGRPSKLTPAVQTAIVERLEQGVSIENVISVVDIGRTTFYEWLAIGNAHLTEDTHPRMPRKIKDRQVFADFANAVTRARDSAIVRAEEVARGGLETQDETLLQVDEVTETRLRTVKREDGTIEKVPYEYRKITKRTQKRSVPPDPRFALEYLWRRKPHEWARKQLGEVTGKDGGPVEIKFVFPETAPHEAPPTPVEKANGHKAHADS